MSSKADLISIININSLENKEIIIIKKGGKYTRLSRVSEDALNHGGDFILSNRPERLKPLRSEELEVAELPDLDIVRSVIRPNQIHTVPAQIRRGSGPEPVRQALIIVLEHLLGQLRRGDHHIELRAEVHREYRAELLRPLEEVPEPHRLYVIQVAYNRQRPRPRRKLEAQLEVKLVGEEDEED